MKPRKKAPLGFGSDLNAPGLSFAPPAPLSHFGNSLLGQVGGPLSKPEIPAPAWLQGFDRVRNARALVWMP